MHYAIPPTLAVVNNQMPAIAGFLFLMQLPSITLPAIVFQRLRPIPSPRVELDSNFLEQ
jgi:hypothetical protein